MKRVESQERWWATPGRERILQEMTLVREMEEERSEEWERKLEWRDPCDEGRGMGSGWEWHPQRRRED